MNRLFYYSSLLVFTILISCSRHPGDGGEKASVSIQFLSPGAGAMFQNGDSILVEANIQGTSTLHGYEVWIRKANDTTTYFYQHVHDHSQSIMARHIWKNTINGPANMEVIITVPLDHDGNTATKRAGFVVM